METGNPPSYEPVQQEITCCDKHVRNIHIVKFIWIFSCWEIDSAIKKSYTETSINSGFNLLARRGPAENLFTNRPLLTCKVGSREKKKPIVMAYSAEPAPGSPCVLSPINKFIPIKLTPHKYVVLNMRRAIVGSTLATGLPSTWRHNKRELPPLTTLGNKIVMDGEGGGGFQHLRRFNEKLLGGRLPAVRYSWCINSLLRSWLRVHRSQITVAVERLSRNRRLVALISDRKA